jgi:hypothetical protein
MLNDDHDTASPSHNDRSHASDSSHPTVIVGTILRLVGQGAQEPRAQNRTIFRQTRAAVVPGPRAGPEAVTIGRGPGRGLWSPSVPSLLI